MLAIALPACRTIFHSWLNRQEDSKPKDGGAQAAKAPVQPKATDLENGAPDKQANEAKAAGAPATPPASEAGPAESTPPAAASKKVSSSLAWHSLMHGQHAFAMIVGGDLGAWHSQLRMCRPEPSVPGHEWRSHVHGRVCSCSIDSQSSSLSVPMHVRHAYG